MDCVGSGFSSVGEALSKDKTIEGIKGCESYVKAISRTNMHSGGVNWVSLVFAHSFAILKVTE